MGAALAGAVTRPGGGRLPAVYRLYKPRRETPWHEPRSLDDGGHSYSQRPWHPALLRAAAAVAERLPTMRDWSRNRLQLLPAMQLQAAPELPAMPADDRAERHLLSVLRNLLAQP